MLIVIHIDSGRSGGLNVKNNDSQRLAQTIPEPFIFILKGCLGSSPVPLLFSHVMEQDT